MRSNKWYLKWNISCDAHLLNELLETDVPWNDAIVLSAGKLRKLWDSLSELRSSVCERRLERTVQRPMLLPVKTAQFIHFFPSGMTSQSKIAQFTWECIRRLKMPNVKLRMSGVCRDSGQINCELPNSFEEARRCTQEGHFVSWWWNSGFMSTKSFAPAEQIRVQAFYTRIVFRLRVESQQGSVKIISKIALELPWHGISMLSSVHYIHAVICPVITCRYQFKIRLLSSVQYIQAIISPL